jgi:uncharacterized protein (TIGR03083 family)
MDTDGKWAAIARERRALSGLLAGLDEPQWESPSLCAQWRVRHVALTPRSPGVGRIVLRAIGARGDFDALNRDMARAHADRAHADLVTELHADAGSRRKPAITTLDNLLFDVLVHVQDIAVPLGLSHAMPLDAARAGAERVWRMGWPFHARRTLRGLRLEPPTPTSPPVPASRCGARSRLCCC